jgi:hypothetical protein
MLLNSILADRPSPVPDALPVRARQVRPQALPTSASSHAASPPTPVTADDVHVQWRGSEGVIVTFTDRKSGKVVRQIPAEQVLSVARFIRQMLDEQATSKGRTRS